MSHKYHIVMLGLDIEMLFMLLLRILFIIILLIMIIIAVAVTHYFVSSKKNRSTNSFSKADKPKTISSSSQSSTAQTPLISSSRQWEMKFDEEYFSSTSKSYIDMINDKGQYGEYLTYVALKNLSGKRRFLFNLYIPAWGKGTTEIDVLLIHESGLYIFESKNYSGWIFGTEDQRKWTQCLSNGKKVQKIHFYNPIMQNETHMKWLKKCLKRFGDIPIYSYIVFGDKCKLKDIKLTTNKHTVINRYNVGYNVAAKANAVSRVMTDETIDNIYNELCKYAMASDSTKAEHNKYIKNTYKQ